MVSHVEATPKVIGFRRRLDTLAAENVYHASFTSVKDFGCRKDMVKLTDAYQAHDDQACFGSGDKEEAPDCGDDKKKRPVFSTMHSTTSLLSKEPNWMKLLFLQTRGTITLTQKFVHS